MLAAAIGIGNDRPPDEWTGTHRLATTSTETIGVAALGAGRMGLTHLRNLAGTPRHHDLAQGASHLRAEVQPAAG